MTVELHVIRLFTHISLWRLNLTKENGNMVLNRIVDKVDFKMYRFAFCPGLDTPEGNKLQYLANVAADEQWFFEGRSPSRLDILYNYIHHTFNHIHEEQKIVFLGEKCYFNTGLFTKHFEEVFGVFEKNRRPNAQEWFFYGFFAESNIPLPVLPERADYFNDISDIIFDYRLPIRINTEHILSDKERVKRLPLELRNVQNLSGAVQMTLRRIKTNYRLPVPQFYFGTKKIQLLIPLYSSDPRNNEVKAVIPIEKDDTGTLYLGRTCLDMEQAYNNARLIAKLDSAWLAPQLSNLVPNRSEAATTRERS